MHFVSGIIVAAGNSTRMGNKNKLFLKLCGKPVIEYTLSAFADAKNINEIIIVTKQENIEQIKSIANSMNLNKPLSFALGGNSRQQSVQNGIFAANKASDFVAIHDGARPLVKSSDIDSLVESAFLYNCITPGLPVVDTIKITDSDGKILSTPTRSSLRAVQTPQVFNKQMYLDALTLCKDNNTEFTDDCMLMEAANIPVHVISGDRNNIKITTPDDILKAETILKNIGKEDVKMRIGHGYDVHKLVKDRKLIIGGVEIPYEKGLLGHSDADVLTHAVMDALLGGAALGDIGKLFPDTSDKYKDADSLLLLKEVCRKLDEKGYRVVNIDCTLIAQKPKLAPYIEKIRENYAEIIGIEKDCVNVKATTEEHLGFTGNGEGMSAHAVCLLESE